MKINDDSKQQSTTVVGMIYTVDQLKSQYRPLWVRVICTRINDLLYKAYRESGVMDILVRFILPCGTNTTDVNVLTNMIIDHAFEDMDTSATYTQYEGLLRVMEVCALVTAEVVEGN